MQSTSRSFAVWLRVFGLGSGNLPPNSVFRFAFRLFLADWVDRSGCSMRDGFADEEYSGVRCAAWSYDLLCKKPVINRCGSCVGAEWIVVCELVDGIFSDACRCKLWHEYVFDIII